MESLIVSSTNSGRVGTLPPATGSSRINVSKAERILSVVAGTALGIFAVKNFKKYTGKSVAVISALLLKRGLTGYCEVNTAMKRNTAFSKASAMEVSAAFTINKSREEVYAFWRNLENLPRFMNHLHNVRVLTERTSHWTAKLPGGIGKISWDAVVTDEAENERLAWMSLPGSTIDNSGEVRFKDAPRNEGTEIHAHISYRLPAGDLGSVAAKLFSPLVESMIREDLRRFKSLMETGEISANASDTVTVPEAIKSLVE